VLAGQDLRGDGVPSAMWRWATRVRIPWPSCSRGNPRFVARPPRCTCWRQLWSGSW